MIFFLTTIIILLCIAIIYLCIDFVRQRKIFRRRIDSLEEIIVRISKKHLIQSDQIKLSDSLSENLKKSKSVLNSSIFDLNYELFDILSKNDLLKK